jgi:hypothetical protein
MPSPQPGDAHQHADLADELTTAVERAGYEWWWTPTGTTLVSQRHGMLVVALDGVAQVLREGHDPDVVTGGADPHFAVEVAGEWLAAGICPGDVPAWLRAGCWRPEAAREMTDVGIRPAQLVADDGSARHLVDSVSGWPIPLARAVADDEMTASAALAYLREIGDTHHVQVERVEQGWRVIIEDVAVIGVRHLGEVEAASRDLLAADAGCDPDEIHVVADLRLPPPIRSRLDRVSALCRPREPDDGTELQVAACELVAIGLAVPDVAHLLRTSTRAVHGLLRHRPAVPGRPDSPRHRPR